jgi:hypothetical protein
MAETNLGFRVRGRLSGGPITIQKMVTNATATLTAGDTVTHSSGKLVLGATSSVAFCGICLNTKAGTASVTTYDVATDPDLIFSCYDPNARAYGATLDVAGATGAQTVATSSNKEFVVIKTKDAAADETLLTWNTGVHILKLKV